MAQKLATTLAKQGSPASPPQDDNAVLVALWRNEIIRAQKALEKWLPLSKKIVKRYRDEEKSINSGSPRYSILYSNTETMLPALYAQPPKAVVARRYLDKDPVGRIACRILQRSLQYQIDAGDLNDVLEACVKDYLLPGRGQLWVMYDPEFEFNEDEAESDSDEGDDEDDDDNDAPENGPESAPTKVLEKLKAEMVGIDFVNYLDFLHDPARIWKEVDWVARRVYMNRAAINGRFKNLTSEQLAKINFSNGPTEDKQDWQKGAGGSDDDMRKAAIWEIWHKSKRKVLWITDGLDEPLDMIDDPLRLKDFYPCPRPLLSITTTDTMVPVPFYQQYKSQADEMDDITGRIDRLIAAAQVRGVYDASIPELARILKEGVEGDLIPVKNWAGFMLGGGLKGAIEFVPIDAFIDAIKGLYEARDRVKNDINEISGISDIIRGQGDPDETATGVNKKSKFASLRLKRMRKQVARFARDTIRIMSEIIAGQFDPESLEQMSSAQEMDDLIDEVPVPPPPSPMMGHNGGPPMDAPPGPPQAAPPAAAPPLPPQRLTYMAPPRGLT